MSIQVPLLVIDRTCLGHVYIVLEPVGSARLRFCDNRYYEFMCFDVPKVVWSPRSDHGHDEVSRNGRDIKIDILDDNVWTSERFRVIRVFFEVPESYGNSSGEVVGLNGPYRKGEKGLFLPSPSPFPFFLFHVGGGILLGLGSPSSTPHFGHTL